MLELRALIWDVDGTLAETERDGHRVAFNRAFSEAGLDWFWDETEYGRLLAVTGGRERMLHYALQRGVHPCMTDALEPQMAQIHKRKNLFYQRLVEDGAIMLRPGVRRLLREARDAGLKQAIATTTSRGNVRALLDACLGTEYRSLFEVTVCGEDVRAKKPDPEVYLQALLQLGMLPSQCIALEDSRPGATAAFRAGLDTLLIPGTYTDPLDVAQMAPSMLAVVVDLDCATPERPQPVTLARLRQWRAGGDLRDLGEPIPTIAG